MNKKVVETFISGVYSYVLTSTLSLLSCVQSPLKGSLALVQFLQL